MGDLIFDVVKRKISVETGALYNENMEMVRKFQPEGADGTVLGPPESGDPFYDYLKKQNNDELKGDEGEKVGGDGWINVPIIEDGLEDANLEKSGGEDDPVIGPNPKPPDPDDIFEDLGGVIEEDGESKKSASPEGKNEWTDEYITLSRNETMKSVAQKFEINITDLRQHNALDKEMKILPKAKGRLPKGKGLWLPDGTLQQFKERKLGDQEEEGENEDLIVDRVFRRFIPGFAWHYGIVLSQIEGQEKFWVLYDDGDKRKLKRNEIAPTLLPKGTGRHHVQQALDDYSKAQADKERADQIANAAYSGHSAHMAKTRRDKHTAFSSRELVKVDNYAADMPLWDVMDDSFEELMPELKRVKEFAHMLVGQDGRKMDERRTKHFRGRAKRAFNDGARRYTASLVEALSHLRQVDIPTPKSYEQAIKGDFAEYWRKLLQLK